jgi:hypothetical protein
MVTTRALPLGGLVLVATMTVHASCGSHVDEVAGAGQGGDGNSGEGAQGGAPPEPPDPCDAFDDSVDPPGPDLPEPCCSQPGCVWVGSHGKLVDGRIVESWDLGCVSDDRLCHFNKCGSEPTVDKPCPDGYECAKQPTNGSPDDCSFGEECAIVGYCVWVSP